MSLEFFIDIILPAANRNGGWCIGLTTFMCRLSWNLGTSTSWNPQDMSTPLQGLLCLVHFYILKFPEDGTPVRSLIAVMNCTSLSTFVGWCIIWRCLVWWVVPDVSKVPVAFIFIGKAVQEVVAVGMTLTGLRVTKILVCSYSVVIYGVWGLRFLLSGTWNRMAEKIGTNIFEVSVAFHLWVS